MNEAVSVIGYIVFQISVTPLADLNFGAVGVGRSEVGNSQTIPLVFGIILNQKRTTGCSGLSEPIPAQMVLGFEQVAAFQLCLICDGVGQSVLSLLSQKGTALRACSVYLIQEQERILLSLKKTEPLVSRCVSEISYSLPLFFRKDLDLISLAVCSGLQEFCINKIIICQFAIKILKRIQCNSKQSKRANQKVTPFTETSPSTFMDFHEKSVWKSVNKLKYNRTHREKQVIIEIAIIIHSMNTDVLSRLSQIKQYINNLNGSLTSNDQGPASVVISKFKQSMMKTDPHLQSNQFILDCLRSRNQKLHHQLFSMQSQKKGIESKLASLKNSKKQIKQSKADIYITRLTLSLNQSKKVEYDEVSMHSDYQQIYLDSTQGNKYKGYVIKIEEIQQVEQKNHFMYFCVIGEKTLHVIVRFRTEREAMRWTVCLKYGQMIMKFKRKKDRLFEEQRENDGNHIAAPNHTQIPISHLPPAPVVNSSPPMRNSLARNSLSIPQMSFLNLNAQNKQFSPTESVISEKKFAQKSFQKESGDRSVEKSERSLINAMNYDGNRSSGTFNVKQPINPTYSKRIDLNRPPNLIKLRGSFNNTDKNTAMEHLKLYKPTGPRKQSEDIIKPHINQVYHEKMLENYRSQQENGEQIKSQQPFVKIPPLQSQPFETFANEKSAKIKMLEEKKKELLKQSNLLSIEKPTFVFDNKVSWMGIEEMDDQNKSKSSNRISNKSRKGSEFSESIIMASSDHVKRETHQEQHSEHITEKSQEQSPKLPKKSPTYDVPHKISYANGIVFQLHQVQKTTGVSTPLLPSKQQPNQRAHNFYESQSSSSLDSSDDHSDPSSHQNHTQSQDNNARSQQLKKGIILTKCSENGFWTHEKIVYLSESENELCSRDLKDKKIKKIRLSNIKEVEYKKFDKGIIKHVSKIEQDKCLVIRALDDDNKIKNFEFVGNLAQPLQRFAANLKLFVQYYKKQ